MDDPPPPAVVLYRVRHGVATFRVATGNPHNPWRETREWVLADTRQYNGYTDSQTGAEAFIDDHSSEQALADLLALCDFVHHRAWDINIQLAANRIRATITPTGEYKESGMT